MRTAALPEDLATRADQVRWTVATNLDTILKRERWSRRAAALALGLSHRYVNDRATGDVDLSASDLAMFADFLEVSISDFYAPIPEGSDLRTLVPKVAGSIPVGGTVIPFPARSWVSEERAQVAPVTAIRAAVAAS